MQIIPSIFIRGGKSVAIGESASIFDTDPVAMCKLLASVGAEMVCITDLDVPPTGTPTHLKVIEAIAEETNLKIMLTGNIRSVETTEKFANAGADMIIIGTIAYQKPDFLKDLTEHCPGKIAVPVDVRRGKVTIKGWTVAANKTALDYAEQFAKAGVTTIIYSDVETEGKLTVKDIERVIFFAKKSLLPVIHATDVGNAGEREILLKLESPKILGTIIGKSMYDGTVDISSMITHMKEISASEMDEETLIP